MDANLRSPGGGGTGEKRGGYDISEKNTLALFLCICVGVLGSGYFEFHNILLLLLLLLKSGSGKRVRKNDYIFGYGDFCEYFGLFGRFGGKGRCGSFLKSTSLEVGGEGS